MADLKMNITIENVDEVKATIERAETLVGELKYCLWQLTTLKVKVDTGKRITANCN